MEFILTAVYTLFFSWIIFRIRWFRVPSVRPSVISAVFIAKVLAGIMLYMVYTYYYTDRSKADIYRFFDDSAPLYKLFFTDTRAFFMNFLGFESDFGHGGKYAQLMSNWSHPYGNNMYNDNRVVIRLHTLIRFFSFGYYNVHTVFFSFISFTGVLLVGKAFYRFAKKSVQLLFVGMQLIPSLLFWSSGCLKESILMFAIGTVVFNFFAIYRRHLVAKNPFPWFRILMVLTGLYIIYLTKFYMMVVIVPAITGFVLCARKPRWKPWAVYPAVVIAYTALGANLHHIHPRLDLITLLADKQEHFVNLSLSENSGSLVSSERLEASVKDFIAHTPDALVNSFLRPFPWQLHSLFEAIAFLENLVFFLLLGCIFFYRKRRPNLNLTCFCITVVLLLYILVGLTTPVTGGIVRYKVPGLPFLWMVLVLLLDTDQLVKWVEKFKK